MGIVGLWPASVPSGSVAPTPTSSCSRPPKHGNLWQHSQRNVLALCSLVKGLNTRICVRICTLQNQRLRSACRSVLRSWTPCCPGPCCTSCCPHCSGRRTLRTSTRRGMPSRHCLLWNTHWPGSCRDMAYSLRWSWGTALERSWPPACPA